MQYTVKQLAKLSGVSSRTLRFYDEIDLLKPAFYGENQYRYYEEEQLLTLQQILFFRELGFPLRDIERIMHSNDFDKIESLTNHKSVLENGLEKTKRLLKTIDKTISHLRGKLAMRPAELFDGFDMEKQKRYEQYLIDNHFMTEQEINASWDKARDWTKKDWEQFKQEGDDMNHAFVDALNKNLPPNSLEAQALVRTHYNWVKNFWTPTRETYLGLAKQYQDNSEYRAFYEAYDPRLVDYIFAAMKVFAEHELS
jgi:DNA-binding transcriptional MerR regulator